MCIHLIASSNPEAVVVQPAPEVQEQAAVRLQSIWRGRCARIQAEKVKKPLLSCALLEQAKPYIDTPANRHDIPRASSGTIPVYLPKELPIVLKRSGSPENQDRFERMKQARQLCERNGYQCLIVPKAQVYKDFIIESRLPIIMHGTKKQIGLYIENRQRFSRAVKEFTGLLCQSTLYDITGGSDDPYGTLSKTPLGRYDNIALYLEGDQGKIGLVDLENFFPGKGQEERCFFECRAAVHLFPLHLDEIVSAATKFDSDAETYRQDLEQEREEALRRFKIVYEDHLAFVIEKGITWENSTEFEELGPLRIAQLQGVVEIAIRKQNNGALYEGCLGEKPDESMACFNAEAFPTILDAIYKLIRGVLAFNLASNEAPPSSYPELLSLRTLKFGPEYEMYHDFMEDTSQSMSMLKFKKASQARALLSVLVDVILEELERGREIAYYNPSFGYGGYATKCVFC